MLCLALPPWWAFSPASGCLAQTFPHVSPIGCSTTQQETSRQDVDFRLKERDIDVAVATK